MIGKVAGRFSDGLRATSVEVDVALDGRGILIELPGTPEPLVWPYGALAVASPLGRSSTEALVTYAHMPGATLFVESAPFAQGLASAAPALTARAGRWRAARPWIWTAAAVAAIGFGVWAAGLSPARVVAGMLPDGARQKLGAQVIASMTANRRTCAAPAGVAALDALVERLTEAGGGKNRFKVTIVDWRLLNAFAAPGEQIVLTREIIEKARSPEEVAGVLAHEMGHGIERHPETGIVRAIGLTAAIELVTGGASGGLVNIGLVLTQLSYTRAAEREADTQGLRLLKGAGISPSGIVDFFKRVQGVERKGSAGGGLDILRTHPQSEERARLAASQAPYPTTPALDPAAWAALQRICG
jgi:Zn-dependent protease with chaperone function